MTSEQTVKIRIIDSSDLHILRNETDEFQPCRRNKKKNKSMTETLAPHERLALYNLTDEEIEKIEEELVKHFPREEFAEIHIEVWRTYEETGALQIHKLIEAKYPGNSRAGQRAITWFKIAKVLPHRVHRNVQH